MPSFFTLSEIINNVISIVVAVILLYVGDRLSNRSRLSWGKEPRDEATCAVHILNALNKHLHEKKKTPTWEELYEEATEQINNVTEGGNYSTSIPRKTKDNSHSDHMRKARKGLIKCNLMDETNNAFKITELGKRLLDRTHQYKSQDERDAVFEDFYLLQIFSPPPPEDRDRDHYGFLNGLLPEGQKGQIYLRTDCEPNILILLRFKLSDSHEQDGRLPAIEWVSVEINSKEPKFKKWPSDIDFDWVDKTFELSQNTYETYHVEHSLRRVRNKIDKAWPPDELQADQFKTLDTDMSHLYTLVRWVADCAIEAAVNHVKDGWAGQFGKTPEYPDLRHELESRIELPSKSSSSSDHVNKQRNLTDNNLQCVAWAALVPRPSD